MTTVHALKTWLKRNLGLNAVAIGDPTPPPAQADWALIAYDGLGVDETLSGKIETYRVTLFAGPPLARQADSHTRLANLEARFQSATQSASRASPHWRHMSVGHANRDLDAATSEYTLNLHIA